MNIIEMLILGFLCTAYLIGIIVSISIILENRDPSKTMAWLLIFILLPGLGLIIYICFGRNLRKRKICKTKKIVDDIKEKNLFENLNEIEELVQLEKESMKTSNIYDDENNSCIKNKVVNLLLNMGRFPFTTNNNVQIYIDGNEKFEALINDLNNAKDHIHMEYFIIKRSSIGNQIKDILIKKANEGVDIKILYDDVGCWRFLFDKKFFEEMKKNNIKIKPFLPAKFPFTFGKINYRNHRKIAVIDGTIGYMGGINIGDEYIGKNKKFGYWRDTHIRIEGTTTYMLQMVFLMDWYYTTKKSIFEKKYFPKIDYKGDSMVQVVASGPDSDWESIHYAYLSAISQAKKRVYIETPYFIPDDSLLRALKSASLSGVDVRIIFPKIADHKIVHQASFSYFDDILRTGGKIYLYNKGFIHSKLIIIDDEIVSTGSANMDLRSFMLNFEINAFLYDKKNINIMVDNFIKDMKNSEEISLDDYSKRPIVKKIRESIARLFSPIL